MHICVCVCTKLLGVFAECNTEDDQKRNARQNVFLLYDLGVFTTLVQLLSMEIEYVDHRGIIYYHPSSAVCFNFNVLSSAF